MKESDQIRFKQCLQDSSDSLFAALEAKQKGDADKCHQFCEEGMAALRKAIRILNGLECMKS